MSFSPIRGQAALARETGLSPSTVSRHLSRGRTPDDIRALVRKREVRGEQKKGPGEGKRGGWVDGRYVPKRRKAGGGGGGGSAPVPPSVPPTPPRSPVDPSEEPVFGKEDLGAAMLRKEIALADQRELEVQIRRKEVLPIGPINAWFARCIHKARDILMRIGPELQDRIGVEAAGLVDKEIRRALEQLKEYEGE